MTTFSDRSPSTDITLPIPSTENKEISDHLRARLEKVDALEQALSVMTDKYNDVLEDLGKVNSERDALKQLDIRQEEVQEKEVELKEREALLLHSTSFNELKILAAEQRVNDHIDMVKLIFRNPITRIKSTVPVVVKSGSQHSGQYDQSGAPIMVDGGTHVSEETSTSEEEEM